MDTAKTAVVTKPGKRPAAPAVPAISRPMGLEPATARAPKPPPQPEESLGLEAFRSIDRMREALTAQATGGLSPAALALAFMDWSIHLAVAPGKRMELVWKGSEKAGRFGAHLQIGRASCRERV